jgi:hypothetical protein
MGSLLAYHSSGLTMAGKAFSRARPASGAAMAPAAAPFARMSIADLSAEQHVLPLAAEPLTARNAQQCRSSHAGEALIRVGQAPRLREGGGSLEGARLRGGPSTWSQGPGAVDYRPLQMWWAASQGPCPTLSSLRSSLFCTAPGNGLSRGRLAVSGGDLFLQGAKSAGHWGLLFPGSLWTGTVWAATQNQPVWSIILGLVAFILTLPHLLSHLIASKQLVGKAEEIPASVVTAAKSESGKGSEDG